ncbi:DUF4352 domain-containing protein [Microbacterium sp. HD4P20]|uniref:DUF4352 domain-containing protein n=1 Tax=Microbacterium sp. HD4P20 TaxID=2864874 RepID=UPI0020A265C4|nr:DUF4352 domain-containing protein [Microbacterium sp. HD4P20]MCP2635833.1 DUF4352 domain-containing protein [Microbacterium sp. HD4P20]
MPRWATWAIGTALVVAAWFVALVTPGEDKLVEPFAVNAALGTEATGRNIQVTVTELRRTPSVSAGSWSAGGNWLVVELDAASVVSEFGVLFNHAELVIDGVRYGASERPDSLRRQGLSAGISRAGSVAFELPKGLAEGAAVLEFAINGDTRLDSVILVEFDLEDVRQVDDVELAATGWTTP